MAALPAGLPVHRPDRPSTPPAPDRDRARRASFAPTVRVILADGSTRECPATREGFVDLLARVKVESGETRS